MNEKWKKLIKECEQNGYTPGDVQRILFFYETMVMMHEKMKKYYEEDDDEHNH